MIIPIIFNCSPMIDNKVIPIQERIRKCKYDFKTNNVICIRCIAYSSCKRIWIDNMKIPKKSITNVKGKRKGR